MATNIEDAILPRAKVALRTVTTDSNLEAEIKGLILAGKIDIEQAGIDTDNLYVEGVFDEWLLQTILLYVRLHYGEPSDPERLQNAYNYQLSRLQNSSDYNVNLEDD